MRRGFTLTEILVVIVLIILLLGMAVPAFNLIKGSRSVEGAENQINALIGRARTDAIGLQKPFGVMFFYDAANERVGVAEVMAADFPDTGSPKRDVYLDLAPDVDRLYLPAGVMAQTLNNFDATKSNDQFLGLNNVVADPPGGNLQTVNSFGGVILFGGDGTLISRTYGFRTQQGAAATPTSMGTFLLNIPTNMPTPSFVEAGYSGNPAPSSALGFVLFDAAAFKNNGDNSDPQMDSADTTDTIEEIWIYGNSVPLLINRYNGTLIRAE